MDYLFLLCGPAMAAAGIIVFFKRMKFAKESKIISGEVTEIRTRPASKNKVAYYPLIRYNDPMTMKEDVFESRNPYEKSRFSVGDRVELRYQTWGDKKKVCLNDWFALWGLACMLLLFGFIFSVLDAVLLFKAL